MNKTTLHILITTSLFLGILVIISVLSLLFVFKTNEPSVQETASTTNSPMARNLPIPANITPTAMSVNENSDIALEKNNVLKRDFGLFVLATILLAVIFSVIIAKLAQKPLKEALEKQKKFVADASHELKTPLSLISSEVQLFQERYQTLIPTNEEVAVFTKRVLVDIKRLTDITNDLLRIAKLASGERDTIGESISLAQTTTYLESLSEKMKEQYPTHSIKFINEIERKVSIHGSPQDLRQVVEILLENACLHTPDNTEIELTQTLEAEQYQLRISDNGPGIAKEHLGRLFERFFQVPGAKGKIGTGLGLPIAKELVERWHGLLLVDSEVGVGTTVTVMLPVAKFS